MDKEIAYQINIDQERSKCFCEVLVKDWCTTDSITNVIQYLIKEYMDTAYTSIILKPSSTVVYQIFSNHETQT